MGIVMYTPHVALQERRRTPAGKVASWLYSRAAGTFLQSSVSFLFFDSQIARVSTAITIGLAVGFLADFGFSFSIASVLGPTAGWGAAVASCIVLAAVAGAGAGGAPGGISAAFWGWLIGGAADWVAVDILSDPASKLRLKILAWLLTALAGWLVGLLAAWLYRRVTEHHPRIRRIFEGIAIVVVVVAVSFFLWRLTGWLLAVPEVASYLRRIPGLASSLLETSPGRWGVGSFIAFSVGVPVYWLGYWIVESIKDRELLNPVKTIGWLHDEGFVAFWLLVVALTLCCVRLGSSLPWEQ